MAIIQSILVGKGKGKIGNVVLSGLKGQTVAKQLNSSPSNPRTVAQTANRVKMANAVLAWQFLSMFFSYAKGLRKPLESVYNAFIRTVVKDMSGVLETSRGMAAKSALDLKLFLGNWFTIAITDLVSGSLQVSFNNSGASWSSDYRIVCINYSSTNGDQKIIERPLTASEFNAGQVEFTVAEIGVLSNCSAYIYDNASSKITNVPHLVV